MNEKHARMIFAVAISNSRAAELLEHLFDGGGVTLDVGPDGPHDIILISPADLEQLARP